MTMSNRTNFSEERIAGLLAALPPAPQGWSEAAQELPLVRASLDELVARAEHNEAYRQKVLADLEAALSSAGVVPAPSALAALRARLS